MAVITANTGAQTYNTNGAWVGGVQPTAADDVVIPATSVVTIPTATTVLGRSCTVQASGQLAFASTTAVLNLGDGTAGLGNVAFSNAGTITLTGIGVINFISTSATVQTITTGGQTMPALNFTGSTGSWQLADNLTTTGAVTHTGGTYDANGKTISELSFASTGAVTRILTFGSANITITGVNTVLQFTGSGLTFTANTATITNNGTNSSANLSTFNTNGLSFVQSGSGNPSLTGSCTLANYTRTGTASKSDTLIISGNPTITNTFRVNSNSDINRVLVQGTTVGTPQTITAATVVITNTVDFQDITGAGAATWTVAGTGATALGDCQGNSGITFTPTATQTHTSSAGGNWSDVTKWTSRVPLPQDNVVVDVNTTGTLTADMPRMGANLTFTGFAGTLNFSVTNSIYGNLTLASGLTLSGFGATTFSGRGNQAVTSAGKTFGQAITFAAPGGTYALQDAFTTLNPLAVTDGTYTDNGFTTTSTIFTAATRTLTLNLTGTISLTTTSAFTIWNTNAGTTTLNATTSTIVVSTASANTRTFSGGGKVFGTLVYTVASSPGSLTITGANTFANITATGGRIITMPSATTNTVSTFNVNGAVNGYLYEPGVASNYASAPDSVPLSITGDITLDAYVALDDWTPAATTRVFAKDSGSGVTRSYNMYIVAATGIIGFQCFNAAGVALSNNNSTVAPSIADGAPLWIRACWNSGTGNLRFYTSSDGSVWTQLGTDVSTTAGTIADTAQALEIGGHVGIGTFLQGKYYQARIFNSDLGSTTGTPVFDADFTTKPVGSNTMSESSGNTEAFTGTYLRAPGVLGNYASAPDSAALSITGDITVDVRVAIDDYTPAASNVLLAKYGSASTYSYLLYLDSASAKLTFVTSPDGTSGSALGNTSSVVTGIADGAIKWVRASLQVNDGGGNRVCKFYLSDDGVTWAQLGTTQTTAVVTTIFDSTAVLELGSYLGGQLPLSGKFYTAKVYNSYLQNGAGTPVFNADFTTQPSYTRTFTESSSNAAVVTLQGGVTINGTLAQAGDGRVSLVSSSGGSAATMTSTNQQSVSYLAIQDSTVDASPKWYAGTTSTNVSGNTNWLFVNAPGGANLLLMGVG